MGKQINLFDFIEEAEKSNTSKVIEFYRRGMDYEPLYDGEIGNHRISSDFKNDEGRNFYVEFLKVSHHNDYDFWCDHSIDRDREKVVKAMKEEMFDKARGMSWSDPEKRELFLNARDIKDDYYNYGDIERTRNLKGWNKSSILKLINETFNCSFTELILK